MKQLICVMVMIAGSLSFAVPGRNKLITPRSVRVVDSGKILVTFLAPCETNDSVAYVANSDDSGDRVVAVGVVYSKEVCRSRSLHLLSYEVEVNQLGFTSTEDAEFEPMDIQ